VGTVLIILKVIYVLVCIGLIAVVLIQQGKSAGLSGAISGAGESYWGKNKARSMEGGLHKVTVALAVVFLVLTMLVNIIAELV
jgi:preprotein translocase subunit SecG